MGIKSNNFFETVTIGEALETGLTIFEPPCKASPAINFNGLNDKELACYIFHYLLKFNAMRTAKLLHISSRHVATLTTRACKKRKSANNL